MAKSSMTTLEVAEYMMSTGKFYTAATLSKELNESVYMASGKICNIQRCKKYTTISRGTPVEVKVVDIAGKAQKAAIWASVLQSSWG